MSASNCGGYNFRDFKAIAGKLLKAQLQFRISIFHDVKSRIFFPTEIRKNAEKYRFLTASANTIWSFEVKKEV